MGRSERTGRPRKDRPGNAGGEGQLGAAEATRIRDLPREQRGVIRAWCMYDWANSAFATSGVAAIFPVYFVFLFKEALGGERDVPGDNLHQQFHLERRGGDFHDDRCVVQPGFGRDFGQDTNQEGIAANIHLRGVAFHCTGVLLGLHFPALGVDAGDVHTGEHRVCGFAGVLQLVPASHWTQNPAGRHQQPGIRLRVRGRRVAVTRPPGVDPGDPGFRHSRPGDPVSHCLHWRLVVRVEPVDSESVARTFGGEDHRQPTRGRRIGDGIPGNWETH